LGIDPEAFRSLFIKESFEKEVLTGRRSLIPALAETLPQRIRSANRVNGEWYMDRNRFCLPNSVSAIIALFFHSWAPPSAEMK